LGPSKLILINDHSKIEAIYNASIKYLEEHDDIKKDIATHLWAYHEIGDIVPQTVDNFMSGHFFPYLESYLHLENSCELCLQGFYTYAFFALRSALELGILYVNFALNDKEYEEVLPWISSQIRTPQFNQFLNRISQLENIKRFNDHFDIINRVSELYDELSGFVHTRGLFHSSRRVSRANFNQFVERSLIEYRKKMFSVVSDVIIIMLLKYPIGMQPLPLSQKFGLNIPAGGFLEAYQVDIITSILEPKEREFLKKLSDEDPFTRQIVEHFESLPDLSEEEWKKQIEEFDKENPNLVK